MKLYDVRLRLSGSLMNDVWINDATAAEIAVLRRVHGNGPNEPIAEVKLVGEVKRPDRQERARLELKFIDWQLGQAGRLMHEVLGPHDKPLPQEYEAPRVMTAEEIAATEEIVRYDASGEVVERLEKPEVVDKDPTTIQRTRISKKAA